MPGLLDVPHPSYGAPLVRETDLLPMLQYLLAPATGAPIAPMGLPVGEATAAGPTIRNLAREYLGRGHGDRVADLAEWTPLAAFDTASQGLLGGRDVGALEIAGGLLDLVPGIGKGGALALKLGMAIPAWHGTPHAFKKFLMDKIGTGEGAQAYGHGLYFGGAKGTAESYRQVRYKIDGQSVDWDNPVHTASYMLAVEGSRAGAAERLRKGIARQGKNPDPASIEAVELLERGVELPAAIEQPGNLYRVSLGDEAMTEANLLDWDKPLSEQSEAVRKQLLGDLSADDLAAKVQAEGRQPTSLERLQMNYRLRQERGGFDPSGQAIYHDMRDRMGDPSTRAKTDKSASAALREAGIPGIKYMDQMSRGRSLGDLVAGRQARIDAIADIRKRPPSERSSAMIAEKQRHIAEYDKLIADYKPQTSNYVMFDAEDIEILDQGLLGPDPR